MSYDLTGKYAQLRDYQLDCTESIFDTFNEGADSTIAVLPMSAGKTVIVGAVINKFLEKNPMKVAVMLSHLDILTKQNEESLREFWDLRTGIFQGDRIPKPNQNCIIGTMQSFRNEEKQKQWGKTDRVGLCVIDETHFFGSKSYDLILEQLPDDCILLGVTATPFRNNKDMTSMFDSVAYTISMQELIDRGQLVPPILHGFKVTAKQEPESVHKKIIKLYAAKHRGEKSIVFLKTIAECEKLEQLFRSQNFKAKAVTSKFTGQRRDDLIEAFKKDSKDSVDILITVNVLTAGFSSDNVRSIFMPYEVSSVASYLQRIGRGMRLDEGKDHVDVYVGGEAPEIAEEKYQRMQAKALTAGSTETEEIEQEDYDEDIYDDDGVVFDADTLELSRELADKGMAGLNDLVRRKDFPQDLLNNLVAQKKVNSKALSKKAPTEQEHSFLKRNGVDSTGMTKHEAVYAVSAVLNTIGVHTDRLYPTSGIYKGVPFQCIPAMYQKFLKSDRSKFFKGKEANKNLYSILDKL